MKQRSRVGRSWHGKIGAVAEELDLVCQCLNVMLQIADDFLRCRLVSSSSVARKEHKPPDS